MKALVSTLTTLSLTLASASTWAYAPVVANNSSVENASEDSSVPEYRRYGFSSEAEMENYFAISSVRVEKGTRKLSRSQLAAIFNPPNLAAAAPGSAPVAAAAPPLGGPAPAPSSAPTPTGSGGVLSDILRNETGLDLDQWITLGQKAWQVIVDNKPIANVSTQRLSILPVAQQDWAQMENWKGPAARTFHVRAENLYGMTVVDIEYTIAFNYGGQLGGHGAFLANATVIPNLKTLVWGFQVDSEVEVGSVVNTGTKLDPRPGVELQVKWKIQPRLVPLKVLSATESFFIRGDGTIVHVNGPN
jgi:hypothetical protein